MARPARTIGTNCQKKQLFVMTVRTPSGKTLPGYLAIIFSEQSWVFHAIYQYAFPHLYSSKVCSRICLVLIDEDEAEYKSFEALIETTSDFKQSTVMLCTFHGVWIAFKKDLLTLLEDCECGKVYVNYILFLVSIGIYDYIVPICTCNPRGVVIQAIHASSMCI